MNRFVFTDPNRFKVIARSNIFLQNIFFEVDFKGISNKKVLITLLHYWH